MPKDQFLIVMGNPIDGFLYVGPFDDPEEAAFHGEKYMDDEDFWVVNLNPPIIPAHN